MAKSKVKIATMYDYDSQEKPKVNFDPSDKNSRSVTNQSDKDSTDINLIMKRYEKTGLITDLITGNNRQPMYGDFTEVSNFHEMQSKIARVTQAFEALPASTRSKFNNDPAVLVDFLADPKNDAEAVKLGLKDASVLPVDNPTETSTNSEADKPKDQPKTAAKSSKKTKPSDEQEEG